MKIKTALGDHFNDSITTTLEVFDTMVKPILLYSSDFWGCLKLPKDNHIDKLYISICKQLLGVQKQTTNIGVLLELGKIPLNIYAKKYAIKNWERIKMKKSNELLQSSYNDALRNNLLWISQIKTLLESKGMLDEFLRNDRDTPYTNILIFQRLCDEFHQNAFATIQDETSKLRTYSLFKSKIGFENYLNTIKNKAIRTEITRFRLSNHQLMIEIGRHRKIPKNLRFCPFCPDTIETEIHFLISCPTYNHNREILTEYFHTLNPSFIP